MTNDSTEDLLPGVGPIVLIYMRKLVELGLWRKRAEEHLWSILFPKRLLEVAIRSKTISE